MRLAFRPARELLADAAAIAERERRRLARLVPAGELVLTGGTSLPDALTGGDVDLHLRVPEADFASAVVALKRLYRSVHPEIWSRTLATFEVPEAPLPTGIAVTPMGSEHDVLFTRSWALLASDRRLLEGYNAMKRRHAGGSAEAYTASKAAFFAALMERRDERAAKPGE